MVHAIICYSRAALGDLKFDTFTNILKIIGHHGIKVKVVNETKKCNSDLENNHQSGEPKRELFSFETSFGNAIPQYSITLDLDSLHCSEVLEFATRHDFQLGFDDLLKIWDIQDKYGGSGQGSLTGSLSPSNLSTADLVYDAPTKEPPLGKKIDHECTIMDIDAVGDLCESTAAGDCSNSRIDRDAEKAGEIEKPTESISGATAAASLAYGTQYSRVSRHVERVLTFLIGMSHLPHINSIC